MNAICAPVTIPLHRPWLVRMADQLWAALQTRRAPAAPAAPVDLYARNLAVLERLSPHTLKDIGAPDWVQGRAAARHSAEQARLQRWLSQSSRHDAHDW